MTVSYRNRTGFTLIELLVVIAIMAVLAALAAGTYFRIRSAQQVNSTEAALAKLNSGFERNWTGNRDQAEKEFASGQLIAGATMDRLTGFAGGPNEKERAKAIYLYLRMKYEYPQTFAETKVNLVLGPSGSIMNALPKSTFREVPVVVDPGNKLKAKDYNAQAAALLYIILTEKSSRGETFDPDSMNGFTATIDVAYDTTPATPAPPLTKQFQVFIDSWGTPITYARFFTNDDLNTPPYSKFNGPQVFAVMNNPAPVALPPGKTNNLFDPNGKLSNVGWNNPNFQAFCTAGGIAPINTTDIRYYDSLQRSYFYPCVVSAGANRDWDGFDVRGRSASPHSNVGIVNFIVGAGIDGVDNVYGYRLRKFGARGD